MEQINFISRGTIVFWKPPILLFYHIAYFILKNDSKSPFGKSDDMVFVPVTIYYDLSSWQFPSGMHNKGTF